MDVGLSNRFFGRWSRSAAIFGFCTSKFLYNACIDDVVHVLLAIEVPDKHCRPACWWGAEEVVKPSMVGGTGIAMDRHDGAKGKDATPGT